MDNSEIQRLAKIFNKTPQQVIQAGITMLQEQADALEAMLKDDAERRKQETQIERVMGLAPGTLSQQRIEALKARRSNAATGTASPRT